MGVVPRQKAIAKITFLLFISVCLCTPVPAEARVFDLLSQFFASEKKVDSVVDGNSQTAELLKAQDISTTFSQDTQIIAEETGAARVVSGPLRVSTEEEVYIPDVDTITIYTVHSGDTLDSVAKMFGVTPNTIMWANDLTSRKLVEGAQLTILPVSGVRYVVKKGDTIKSIAKKYKGDVDEILVFNGISTEAVLKVGDSLLIPDGEIVLEKVDTPKTKAKAKVYANLPLYDGFLIRPISGGTRTTGLHGHNAVDLANRAGTPIMAAASGTVILSKFGGWNGGYGNYVVIRHANGIQTLYAHNSENLVEVGDTVTQGQVIARMGSTGKSTGPHVHFEVRGGRNPF